jgi:hypothetical protein
MMFADELSDAALDAALAAMKRASSPFSLVQFRGLGGAMARVPNDATAFAHRERRFFVAIIGLWLDPSEDPAVHEAWTAALWPTFHREGNGVYVNFLEAEGADRVREAYPPGHVRSSRRGQAALRPRQPLPVQSERSASSDRRLVGGRRYSG